MSLFDPKLMSRKLSKKLKIHSGFKAAEEADLKYYKNLTHKKRLEISLDIMAPFYAAQPRFKRILGIAKLRKNPMLDRWGLGI